MKTAAWTMLGVAIVAFVISMVHLFVVSRQIRPDAAQRFAKWSTPLRDAARDLTVDAFTQEGNRSRRQLAWYSIVWAVLALCGLTALNLDPLDVSLPLVAFGGGGLTAAVVLIGFDVRHVLARSGDKGPAVARADSAPAAPVDPTFGPRFRRRCPCCGFPTLGLTNDLCHLCAWDDSDDESPADAAPESPRLREAALHEARVNFARYLTVDDLAHPQPWMHAPSSRELDLKRSIIEAFTQMEHDRTLDQRSRWYPIFALEHDLALEQEREEEAAE